MPSWHEHAHLGTPSAGRVNNQKTLTAFILYSSASVLRLDGDNGLEEPVYGMKQCGLIERLTGWNHRTEQVIL